MRRILLAIVVIWLSGAEAGEESIEDLQITRILGNENMVQATFACLLDQIPCGQLQPLRNSLPQLIETNCSNCTPRQKEKYDQVTTIVSASYPEQYKQIIRKYSSRSD